MDTRLTIALVIIALIAVFIFWVSCRLGARSDARDQSGYQRPDPNDAAYADEVRAALHPEVYGDVPAVPRRLIRSSQHSRKV